MYVAKDANGEIVAIEDASPNEEYFCPACGESLIQKRGNYVAHHFSHHSKSNCCMTAPMTMWHLGWQREFPVTWREVVFEKNGEQHRADIAHDDLVVEFQHSRITAKDMYKRTQFYRNLGKQIVWIMDCGDRNLDYLLNHRVKNKETQYYHLFHLANPWFCSIIEKKTDIVILDFHDVCAILFDWSINEERDILNIADGCLLVSRNFVIHLIEGFQNLKAFDWSFAAYAKKNEDRLIKSVRYAVRTGFPKLEAWKLNKTLSTVSDIVLRLWTTEILKFPYLYLTSEKRKSQWGQWSAFLSSSKHFPTYDALNEFYNDDDDTFLHKTCSRYLWYKADRSSWHCLYAPEKVKVTLSMAVYCIILSLTMRN